MGSPRWLQCRHHTVDFFALHALDVDDPAATVYLDNLALTALVGSPDNHHLVVLADGQGLDVILAAQLLAQRGRHHTAADVGGGREVRLAALAAGRAHV